MNTVRVRVRVRVRVGVRVRVRAWDKPIMIDVVALCRGREAPSTRWL